MNEFNNVLITGASSGLGASFAKYYAKQPHTTLYLLARNEERLKKVAQECESLGATVITKIIDVINSNELEIFINGIKNLNIVIANAGISAGTLGGTENLSQIHSIIHTNLLGVINTITPAINKCLVNKSSCKIAVISSVAGKLPLASCPAYSTSKAAVSHYTKSIQQTLKSHNIHISLVLPGFIDTPLTKVNKFPMPFLINPDRAALKIINELDNGKEVIYTHLSYKILFKILNLIPNFIIKSIIKILPKKKSF